MIVSTIFMHGELGHAFSHKAAHEIRKPTINTPTHGNGCEISFAEYVKEISPIILPSRRRRDRNFELSPLLALNGQLLWLGMQCLSLLMGQTPQATVGTVSEMNKLTRQAIV